MTYPCVPVWMKEREKDQFDYPLRSAKEIAFEQHMNPPLFTANIVYNDYRAISEMTTLHVHKADNRNNEIKLEMRIEDMFLTPLQKKRLIFLLGPRWRGDGKVKIVMRKYTNMKDNLNKAFETFRQLYWEAKRAPMYIWARMNNTQRRKAARKVFGHKLPENIQELKEKANKEVEEQQKQFYEMYDNRQYTAQVFKDSVQKRLDEKYSSGSAEAKSQEQRELEIQKKTESFIAKEEIEKSLVKKKVLTKKAFETFFRSQEQEAQTK